MLTRYCTGRLQETGGVADPSYTGVEKRGEVKDAQVKGEISKDVTCYVAAKRGSDKGLATN